MVRKIVLAFANREYVGRLAEYLRETEPAWLISAFTHETALRIRLQEAGGCDLAIGHPALLRPAAEWLSGARSVAALVEEPGQAEGRWPEVALFQPLPRVAAAMKELLAGPPAGPGTGCRLLTVFSAAGGAGKTTAALNLVRLAGERGWRTLYLNLETLNATSRLLGIGEPDSLSRLLYGLQSDPSGFAEHLARLVRHQSYLRADFVDAPEHPGERAAMTPELLETLLEGIRGSGRYDLIVADPDSGADPWHRRLIGLSDKAVWLVSDDWQCLEKTARLLRFWLEDWKAWSPKIAFVRNRAQGRPMNRWDLPSPPSAVLPYVPQWAGMDDPVRLFGSAAFCGALESLLDDWGWQPERKEGGGVVVMGANGR